MTSDDNSQHTRRTVLRWGAATGAGVLGAGTLEVTDLASAARSAMPASTARLADADVTGCATLTVEETQARSGSMSCSSAQTSASTRPPASPSRASR
jgi:hypothetical protein